MDVENATEALELLIDRHGLLHVLTGLELICSERAGHTRDRQWAREWDRVGTAVWTCAQQISMDL